MKDEIRAVLIDWVNPTELEWMVASCPSVDDARDEVLRRKGDPNWCGLIRGELKLQLGRADRLDLERIEKLRGRK